MQRVCDQVSNIAERQWSQSNACHRGIALDIGDRGHERIVVADFVVAVCADDHEGLKPVAAQPILQKATSTSIAPLQIVEEDHQRMFPAGEYIDQGP